MLLNFKPLLLCPFLILWAEGTLMPSHQVYTHSVNIPLSFLMSRPYSPSCLGLNPCFYKDASLPMMVSLWPYAALVQANPYSSCTEEPINRYRALHVAFNAKQGGRITSHDLLARLCDANWAAIAHLCHGVVLLVHGQLIVHENHQVLLHRTVSSQSAPNMCYGHRLFYLSCRSLYFFLLNFRFLFFLD